MQCISINTAKEEAPTRDLPRPAVSPEQLPPPKEVKLHPAAPGRENASLMFVGTATTILEWAGIRLMTDPNFLHAGDHVHLGPGVSSVRRTNPAVDLHGLPRIDLVLLSHYHGDHFDQNVEASLRRDLPIITTPHAQAHLTGKGEDSFTYVTALDPFEQVLVDINGQKGQTGPRLRVTGMPGKHVPSNTVVEKLNTFANAIPPTNGWMLELGTGFPGTPDFSSGYRIYISGDTLMVDELREIPRRYEGQRIDLMLAHLGGTTVPSPNLGPLSLMVTMDAEQGLQLVRLIKPDVTIPIHYDDYEVFKSPLEEFRRVVEEAGLGDRVVYLERGDWFRFRVEGDLDRCGTVAF